MLKDKIQKIVSKAIQQAPSDASALKGGQGNPFIEAEISVPENDNFGHYSTNVAMRLAKAQKKSPMQIAEEIKLHLLTSYPSVFSRIEAAAPGFINLWIKPEVLHGELKEILKKKEKYGKPLKAKSYKPETINLEFI